MVFCDVCKSGCCRHLSSPGFSGKKTRLDEINERKTTLNGSRRRAVEQVNDAMGLLRRTESALRSIDDEVERLNREMESIREAEEKKAVEDALTEQVKKIRPGDYVEAWFIDHNNSHRNAAARKLVSGTVYSEARFKDDGTLGGYYAVEIGPKKEFLCLPDGKYGDNLISIVLHVPKN